MIRRKKITISIIFRAYLNCKSKIIFSEFYTIANWFKVLFFEIVWFLLDVQLSDNGGLFALKMSAISSNIAMDGQENYI